MHYIPILLMRVEKCGRRECLLQRFAGPGCKNNGVHLVEMSQCHIPARHLCKFAIDVGFFQTCMLQATASVFVYRIVYLGLFDFCVKAHFLLNDKCKKE